MSKGVHDPAWWSFTRRSLEPASPGVTLNAIRSFLLCPMRSWDAGEPGDPPRGRGGDPCFLEDWLGAYEEYGDRGGGRFLDLGKTEWCLCREIRLRRSVRFCSAGSGLMRRRPLAFIWTVGLIARVTAYADSNRGWLAQPPKGLAESRG